MNNNNNDGVNNNNNINPNNSTNNVNEYTYCGTFSYLADPVFVSFTEAVVPVAVEQLHLHTVFHIIVVVGLSEAPLLHAQLQRSEVQDHWERFPPCPYGER